MAPWTTMTSVLEIAVEQELIQVHVRVSFRSSNWFGGINSSISSHAKIYLSNIFALRATNAFKNEQSFEECAFFHASEIFKTAGSLILWISLLQSI